MKNLFYLLFAIFFTSCVQHNPIEKTLLSNSDEYWRYYTSNSSTFTYFRFKEDHLSVRYYKDQDSTKFSEYEKTKMEESEKWSVTKDSVMTWGDFNYDVVSYNDKAVVLLALAKEKPFVNYIFLIKTKENELIEGTGSFEQKRIFNPEKYPFAK